MKRQWIIICGMFFVLQTALAAPVEVPSEWQNLPCTLEENYDAADPSTYVSCTVHEPITQVQVTYSRRLVLAYLPRLVLYVDGVEVARQMTEGGTDGHTMTFAVNLPYSAAGHEIRVGGAALERWVNAPVHISGASLYTDDQQVVNLYYFDNPEYDVDSCRNDISATESILYSRWCCHRIFTPGAWETFCMPLPIDRVYTHEDDGSEVALIPSTYACPNGHYWIRSFRGPCEEQQVGTNWQIPDSMQVPEAGVGYILMLPDDPWWQGREICFEGRFRHGGGLADLSDEYDETATRTATNPEMFVYLPNTTFLTQQVGEGWLPNVEETDGRYFDNHHDPYTLHPMECHLIGGTATAGIARIGSREVPTGLNEINATNENNENNENNATNAKPTATKRLLNGHIEIIRNGRTYDVLGR